MRMGLDATRLVFLEGEGNWDAEIERKEAP